MGKLLLSDLDGSIIHYESTLLRSGKLQADADDNGLTLYRVHGTTHRLVKLPLSSTAKQGYISLKTVEKFDRIRAVGVPIALLTGSRTTTLQQRVPFLPLADVYAAENGGRLFFRHPEAGSVCFLKEDMRWRKIHNDVAGPDSQEEIHPEKRVGKLWDLYRLLLEKGFSMDCQGQLTCIRVKSAPPGETLLVVKEILAHFPEISCTWNLGHVDLYPATSGKRNVGLYIMKLLGVDPRDSVFICDDDNDMALAEEVGHVFLPSITTDSVQKAIEGNPSHFTSMEPLSGTCATEGALDGILKYFEIEQ